MLCAKAWGPLFLAVCRCWLLEELSDPFPTPTPTPRLTPH